MRPCPHLYEINACVFVKRMSRKYEQALTLATVPDEEWKHLANLGFNLVWLMGVWERSLGSRQKALIDPILKRDYDQALPDWTDDDITGSPYAVYSYRLDPSLGKSDELAQLKQKLNQQGLGLLLDFVPNHLAFDHPWTLTHPDWFVQGRKADVRSHPDWFFPLDRNVYLAHGRDPHFPPWTDTVQVNFWSLGLRLALIEELLCIAEVSDGVRCDMAMLALNDVFQQVWGDITKGHPRPETEFWTESIGRVKERHPDFLFLAEVYWGLEPRLQQLGFDFTYDKPLYDKLHSFKASDLKKYLAKDGFHHQRSVHFIENHDEERAVVAFGSEASLAAAAIIATIPGLRLFHDGQFEGRRIRLPIQLIREPNESPAAETTRYYEQLMSVCNSPFFHEGNWQVLDARQAKEEDNSHRDLLIWQWQYEEHCNLVAINYSSKIVQGWVKLSLKKPTTGHVLICDRFTGKTYMQDVQRITSQGLFFELDPWQVQILEMKMEPIVSYNNAG